MPVPQPVTDASLTLCTKLSIVDKYLLLPQGEDIREGLYEVYENRRGKVIRGNSYAPVMGRLARKYDGPFMGLTR